MRRRPPDPCSTSTEATGSTWAAPSTSWNRGSTAHARLSGTDRAPGAGDLRRVRARVRPGGVVPRRPLSNEPLRRHRRPHPRSPRADCHGRDLVGPCLTISTHPLHPSGHLRGGDRRGRHGGSRARWARHRSPWRSSATTTAWRRWPSPPSWSWDSLPWPAGRGSDPSPASPSSCWWDSSRSASLFLSSPRLPVRVRRQGPGDLRRACPCHRPRRRRGARRSRAGGGPAGGAVLRPAPACPACGQRERRTPPPSSSTSSRRWQPRRSTSPTNGPPST